MNRSIIPLTALTFLLGACSSTPTQSAHRPQPLPAQSAGTLQTAWGELPTYRTADSEFPFVLTPYPGFKTPTELRPDDAPVVDVLVDRDGSIKDVKVHTSSGFEAVDIYAINRFVGARARLQIAPTDPAPYVIRQTMSQSYLSVAYYSSPSPYGVQKDTTMRPMGTGQPLASDRR